MKVGETKFNKLIRIFLLCILLHPFETSAQKSVIKHADKTNSKLESRIIDNIWNLPEVQKESKHLETKSNGKKHLGIVVYRSPNKESKFYWIKVWEDNRGRYISHFNFLVDSVNMNIYYLDTINDTLLDLKTWRKLRK